MQNILDFLIDRGYIEQVTHYEELKKEFENGEVTFYVGIDPTADSLHIGHFMVLMIAKRLQMAGHRPIILLGGGTASIGDPSDRNDMRKLLSKDELNENIKGIKKQVERFVDFEKGALLLDNADWIDDLNYLDFMRTIGIHFNINDMLRMDSYKTRLEKGLTFFEFGYMPLQANDFLVLNERHNCILQMGGNDQWSNIIGGVDLIKKKRAKSAYGFTIKLLTKKDGTKMGKTAGGALWLDENKTTPFDFYQYWRNIEDEMVEQIFKLLTLETDEKIKEYMSLENINETKKILAFKVTEIIHGSENANKAKETSEALFEIGSDISSIKKFKTKSGIRLVDLLKEVNFVKSNSDAKRLISAGGISLNDKKITDINYILSEDDKKDGNIILKKGKNTFLNIQI